MISNLIFHIFLFKNIFYHFKNLYLGFKRNIHFYQKEKIYIFYQNKTPKKRKIKILKFNF